MKAGWRGLLICVAVAITVRAAAFRFSLNHYGDSPIRVELAERWAAHPHLLEAWSDVYQFGPLHIYALGAALTIWPDRDLATRGLSLVFGVLGVAALYLLVRRREGDTAATVAATALALHGLHIQASVSAASEAVFLAFLLFAIDRLFAASDAKAPATCALHAATAGLLLSAAEATRYDGLLYALVCCLMAAAWWRRGKLALAPLSLFVVCAAAFPLYWIGRGTAAMALDEINKAHASLASGTIASIGRPLYAAFCVFYWPALFALSVAPLLAIFSLIGIGDALGKRERLELALLAWAPAIYMTMRGAVLQDFRPLARFTMVASALSLAYAWRGFQRLTPRWRHAAIGIAFGLALLVPTTLAIVSFDRNGAVAEWARPLSPLSTVPPGIAQAAQWIRDHHDDHDVLLVDGVWDYLDIPLAFYAGIPEERLVRRAWTNFEMRLRQNPPTLVAAIYQGELRDKTPGVHIDEEVAIVRGQRYRAVAHFVYATIYRLETR